MKKVFSVLLLLGLLSMIGCAANNAANSLQTDPQTVSPSTPTTAPAAPASAQATSPSDNTPAEELPVQKVELLQRAYTLVNSKKVYGEAFNVKATLTDLDSVSFFSALLDDIALSNQQVENWPKYNPARANAYAVKIFLNDGSIAIINLHYTEQSNSYHIATATCSEDTQYDAFVASENADELFAKHEIQKENAEKLIGLFKE